MIETDFQYYCQDCSRIAPEAKISKFFGNGDEPILTTIRLYCTHQKECARLMRELEAKYLRKKAYEDFKELESSIANGTEKNHESHDIPADGGKDAGRDREGAG